MKDTVYCYACGQWSHIETSHSFKQMENYKNFRDKNKCIYCGKSLELISNIEAGKERMNVEHAEFWKASALKEGFV